MKCEICGFYKNAICLHPYLVEDWPDGVDVADDDIDNGPLWCPKRG